MAADSKKRLRRATIVFWVLLLYIIAALVWWFISLQKQNSIIYELKKQQLAGNFNKNTAPYNSALAQIEKGKAGGNAKDIGEGSIFLLLIIIGGVFIYRSVRRQFKLQLQQQNFMMAITHELKTPISVSRLNLETLQRYQLSEQQKQKLLQTTLQENLRLDGLINNILISAQLEGGAYEPGKEALNLSALITDVVKSFTNRYPDRKILSEIQPDVELDGDALLLKLLVSNLLENAHKYSAKETVISCKLYRNDAIVLQVTDKGVGIANDEKKNVFKQFYRIGNEQTRNTKGTGLGLYISKKIAQAHNALISITDNQPQGSIFTVTFPGQ